MGSFNVWVKQKIDTLERQVRSVIELAPYVGDLKFHSRAIYKSTYQLRYATGTQNIAHATYTIMIYGGAKYNYGSQSSTTRYTAKYHGLYFIHSHNAKQTATLHSGSEFSSIYINGAQIHQGNRSTTTGYAGLGVTGLYELNAGDYVEIKYYQSNGSTETMGGSIASRYWSVKMDLRLP